MENGEIYENSAILEIKYWKSQQNIDNFVDIHINKYNGYKYIMLNQNKVNICDNIMDYRDKILIKYKLNTLPNDIPRQKEIFKCNMCEKCFDDIKKLKKHHKWCIKQTRNNKRNNDVDSTKLTKKNINNHGTFIEATVSQYTLTMIQDPFHLTCFSCNMVMYNDDLLSKHLWSLQCKKRENKRLNIYPKMFKSKSIMSTVKSQFKSLDWNHIKQLTNNKDIDNLKRWYDITISEILQKIWAPNRNNDKISKRQQLLGNLSKPKPIISSKNNHKRRKKTKHWARMNVECVPPIKELQFRQKRKLISYECNNCSNTFQDSMEYESHKVKCIQKFKSNDETKELESLNNITTKLENNNDNNMDSDNSSDSDDDMNDLNESSDNESGSNSDSESETEMDEDSWSDDDNESSISVELLNQSDINNKYPNEFIITYDSMLQCHVIKVYPHKIKDDNGGNNEMDKDYCIEFKTNNVDDLPNFKFITKHKWRIEKPNITEYEPEYQCQCKVKNLGKIAKKLKQKYGDNNEFTIKYKQCWGKRDLKNNVYSCECHKYIKKYNDKYILGIYKINSYNELDLTRLNGRMPTIIIECNDNCECSNNWWDCGNRVIQNHRYHQHLKLYVSKNGSKGWGVFAKEFIKKGTFIGEYIGEIISLNQTHKRGTQYDKIGSSYIWDCNDKSIDATKYGNITRFINHSCNANLFTLNALIESRELHEVPSVAMFAAKNINKFDELTVNYKYDICKDSKNQNAIPCFCKQIDCRGRIT